MARADPHGTILGPGEVLNPNLICCRRQDKIRFTRLAKVSEFDSLLVEDDSKEDASKCMVARMDKGDLGERLFAPYATEERVALIVRVTLMECVTDLLRMAALEYIYCGGKL